MRTLALVSLLAGIAGAQPMDVSGVASEEKVPDGRFELSLFPAVVQLNGMFTQHAGTFGALTWHVRERFALQVLGGGNWYSAEAPFNGELVEKFRVEAQAATSLLWTWGVFGGVEVEPLLATFTLFDGPLLRLGGLLSVGAGAGGTRHLLWPEGAMPATYGDTGTRFMSTFAAGVRMQLGQHFTARLEVRDVMYSARVDRVNGCIPGDIDLRGGTADPPSGACRGFTTPTDALSARSLTRISSSNVVHTVGLYVGAGFLF